MEINIGLLGAGVVGSAVASVLLEGKEDLGRKIGGAVRLKKILVRESGRHRSFQAPPGVLVTDFREVLNDPISR